MGMESASGIPTEFVGRVIADKFRLSECIGIGATGSVYKADQLALGRTVAIKILDPELAMDSRIAKRFHDEALAASRLNHPNTVSIIDFGQTRDGILYLAMEFLRGRTLTQVLADDPPLSTSRIVDITTQILAGLEEAHLAGVVHADLKADNIVVVRRRGGHDLAKVLDFGIARILDTPRQANADRVIAGTPEYMAPEVISGSQPTFASDVYAVGIMMYELLTGQTPFTGGTTMEILTRQLRDEPRPPREVAPDHPFDDQLAEIALRALAKRANDRFPSAALFRKALASLSLAESARDQDTACDRCGALVAATFKFCPECGESRAVAGSAKDDALAKDAVQSDAAQSDAEQSVPAQRDGSERDHGPPPVPAAATAPTIELSGVFPLPLTGRMEELNTLVRFARATDQGGMIQVVGERGSGRSRIIASACAHFSCVAKGVEEDERLVFWATPDPSGMMTTLYPVKAVVAAVLDLPPICTYDDLQNAAIGVGLSRRDIPGIAELFGHEGELSQVEPPVRRREVLAATVRTLHAAMNRGPTLIVFEDVDQYDQPSQELIRRLCEQADERGLRVIVSDTPDIAERWPSSVLRVNISRLDDEALRQLGDHINARAHGESFTTNDLREKTGGLPAAVHHLTRYVVEGGTVADAPHGIADLIAERVAQLQLDARIVCQAAAVFGLEVQVDALARCVQGGVNQLAFDRALAALESRGLIDREGDVIVFESELVQQVVYDGTPVDVRRGLHAAALLELQDSAPMPAVLGHHAEMAGKLDEAANRLAQAGDEAVRQFDDIGACALYHRALSAARAVVLSDDTSEQRTRFVALSVKLAEALRVGGEVGLARGLLEEAYGYASGAPGLEAQLLRASAHLALTEGEPRTAIDAIQDAIGLTIPTGKVEILTELYIDLSAMHLRAGAPEKALQELTEGLNLITLGEGASTPSGPKVLWRLLLRLASLHASLGDSADAISMGEHTLRHANRVGSRAGAARTQSMLAVELEKIGNQQRADHYRKAAVDNMRRLGDRRGTAELLLAGAHPTRSLMRISNASLREARQLAAEVGWAEGLERAGAGES